MPFLVSGEAPPAAWLVAEAEVPAGSETAGVTAWDAQAASDQRRGKAKSTPRERRAPVRSVMGKSPEVVPERARGRVSQRLAAGRLKRVPCHAPPSAAVIERSPSPR